MTKTSFGIPRVRVAIVAALIVSVVLTGLLVAMWDPGDATAATSLTKAEKKLISLINAERKKRGLKTLRVRTSLCRAADRHCRDMLVNDFFSHRSSNGRSLSSRLLRYGYSRRGCRYWSVGELLARGKGAYGTPEMTVRRWMKSKTHRAILLKRKWRDIGVARRKGNYRGTSNMIVTTVDFGRRVSN